MEIKNELPQFNEEKCLIIVAWEHKSKFYIAENKNIILCDLIEVEKAEFTDTKEWKFIKSWWWWDFHSWSVNEYKKQYDQKTFFNILEEKVNSIYEKENFKWIYLFAPQYMLSGIELAIGKFKQNIKMLEVWNLVNHHPFKILEKIWKNNI